MLFYQRKNPDKSRQVAHVKALNQPAEARDHFVPRVWYTRFQTFSDAGPMDTDRYLCAHGRLQPSLQQPEILFKYACNLLFV